MLSQFIEGNIAAHFGFIPYGNAQLLQPFYFPENIFFMKPERRDAVGKRPARLGGTFKNRYTIVHAGQVLRCCQASRAAADNGNRPITFLAGHVIEDMIVKDQIGHEPFQFPDFYMLSFFAQHTGSFTLCFSGADTAAQCGEITAVINIFGSRAKISLCNFMNELRYFIFYGAAIAALGHTAVETAFRFGYGLRHSIVTVRNRFFMKKSQRILFFLGHADSHLSAEVCYNTGWI